ncbi:hypothetical protein [Phaeodactylibacter sp.]|jgi:hypothetical protein|uniref:hypothetical protein n=1 Tax=Phaeodactylibacter sp. TaxID=1940289 RepID=UPI0025ED7BB6|nr:hypothetical protein [Phaeodactylibacter sp.]MCI4651379.1 hypothetical protein [Phaeodactylibacter sp.]MCI5092011.1 hypothetical protein [Phaeodactylibacter sp.]
MKKQNFSFLPALIFATAFLVSCDIINPEEPVPGYLHIPAMRVETSGDEGSASSNLSEAWVSVDGDFVGAYSLPATLPVLEEGPSEVVVQAGVKDNGLGSSPDIYPFFANYETQVEMGPNTTDTIRPVFRYSDNTKFAFIENFDEGGQIFSQMRRGSLSQMSSVTEGAFEDRSLRIELDTSAAIVEAATIERYANLTGQFTTSVYLEVDYKSDVPVTFGVIGYDGSGTTGNGQALFISGFNPSGEWRKIYFNLSVVIVESGLSEFQIVFQAAIPTENGQLTRDEAIVMMDNIKLLHF